MTNPVNATVAEQNYAIAMQIMALTAQKQSADIAVQLIQGAVESAPAANAPQDPSTVTPEQLQSPIDIRV